MTLNINVVPCKGKTQAPVASRFNTSCQKNGRQDADDKQIKACRPVWGKSVCDTYDDFRKYDAIST